MYEIFEQLLQKSGITAYKLSMETGISQTIFSNWKSGRSIPKQDKLQKVAEFFGVTLDYLMGNESDENKENYYYLNEDTREVLQELKVNSKLKILFDASRKLEPSDIDFVINMVERLKKEGK